MPEVVFQANHVLRPGGNRREDMADCAKEGSIGGWTCKKSTREGDLYLFYFGQPDFVVTAVGVAEGGVEEEENKGTFDWTAKERAWFCGFSPLIGLPQPLPRASIESHRTLREWWQARPFRGGPKAIPYEFAVPLLKLIQKTNRQRRRLVSLINQYLGELEPMPARRRKPVSGSSGLRSERILQFAVDKDRLPGAVTVATRRIIRDTPCAQGLKTLYEHECQICGTFICTPHATGRRYSEVHHLRPLGGGHRGKDGPGNMLVVCPTCHAELDLLAIAIQPDDRRIVTFSKTGSKKRKLYVRDEHKLKKENIAYHWRMYQSALR